MSDKDALHIAVERLIALCILHIPSGHTLDAAVDIISEIRRLTQRLDEKKEAVDGSVGVNQKPRTKNKTWR